MCTCCRDMNDKEDAISKIDPHLASSSSTSPETDVGPIDISVILPFYRSAPQAFSSAFELGAFLEGRGFSWELLIVDDGGGDFPDQPRFNGWPIRLLRLPRNRGKGKAVRAGMLAARGKVRVFTDVDLPYGAQFIPIAWQYIVDRGFHVVIGDRTLPGSECFEMVGFKRRLASSLFSFLVSGLVTRRCFDTQCGFKAFRGDVAKLLFGLSRIERFAFDVELIHLALTYNLDIKRIPVCLRENSTSTIRLFRDSAQTLFDVLRIRYNQLRRVYRSIDLQRLASRDFELSRKAALAHHSTHSTAGHPLRRGRRFSPDA